MEGSQVLEAEWWPRPNSPKCCKYCLRAMGTGTMARGRCLRLPGGGGYDCLCLSGLACPRVPPLL